MTTATLVTSTTFSKIARSRILSVDNTNLVGEYLFGNNQTESVKNRANPSLPLTVQGSPTYNTHSAVIRSNASTGYGFQTGIIPDEDFTWILVRKNCTIAGQANVMGMPQIGGSTLYGFREFGTNNYGSGGESTALNGAPNRAKPGSGVIYFEAIAHTPRSYTQFYYGASGTLSTAANAAATADQRRTSGANIALYSQVLIGTSGMPDPATTTNTCEAYYAAIFNRTLTQSEVAQCYSDVKTYLATLSVSVD